MKSLEKDDLKELMKESEAIKNYFDEKAKLKSIDLNKSNGSEKNEEEEQSENDDSDQEIGDFSY
jgi:hypothetical protein